VKWLLEWDIMMVLPGAGQRRGDMKHMSGVRGDKAALGELAHEDKPAREARHFWERWIL